MREYAHLLSAQIDTSKNYILVGVSLGGMICSELMDFLKPEKTILISSAKSRKEFPLRYRFQKTFPLYKIVPRSLLKFGAQLLQPVVEPDRNKCKAIFKSMLRSKSPEYYKRTIDMILNWNREESAEKIIHIHGTNDHTIPIRNVTPTHQVENGSHLMTLTRGDEINKLLLSILLLG
jgi:pimeloyl-ACP methyl ester carboxylesterase